MANLSNYAEDKVLDHLFKNTSYTSPTAYIGYFNNSITDASVPTEVSGNNYARVEISSKMGSSSSGTISNTSAITFPAASGGDHGVITAIAIFDASSSGNMIAYGDLTTSKTISDGDQLNIAIGNLQISID
ncbi:MAG: hypothetical protein K0U53_00150 [Betaproteobacteria bacterium]|nr:hypothetical protein [Betaproteobacteria bacterium]